MPEDELGGSGCDSIVDPAGAGPRIWFQTVPEGKTAVKNRLHLDIRAGGGRGVPLVVRRQRVDAESDRLVGQGATLVRVLYTEGIDHYGVLLRGPEGNEFCLN